jgi:YVTN family beta-propeller protein
VEVRLSARVRLLLALAAVLLASISSPAPGASQLPAYTLFESDPVTPLAMSPDGSLLFAVNTPDGRLEIFEPTADGRLSPVDSVPVGLEPVAVAARSNDEVWVVNHLSDSVSIVDVAANPPRVVRTLLVGDEPRGIVFAGPGRNRAFIATAHRGQNTPWRDGDYDIPGIGRADVWVFDANSLGSSLEGTPLTVVNLFGDRPRALAVTPDGSTVYAAVYRSGNKTVPISEGVVCNGSGPCTIQNTNYPAGRPAPETNKDRIVSRETGLIVGYNEATGHWEDERGVNWDNAVPFSLPDLDVFAINANANPPVQTDSFAGVGTILFNMIVNPSNGKVYVTNTDANNRVRFEGACDYVSEIGPKPSGDPCSVRGNLHQSQITVIDSLGNVTPRHLNKHIDYDVVPSPPGTKERSVATPLGMAVSSDGATLYVAGFGSNGVAVYDTAELENDTFVPSAANLIPIERPSGLILDEARNLLFVSSRKTNSVFSVNLTDLSIRNTGGRYNPEPAEIKNGRKFLYDTQLTSSNGEASCASCHVFGDMDDLSWDLGDPDASPFANQNPPPPQGIFPLLDGLLIINPLMPFDPLKGPMTTQSFRGMIHSGPQHWRGDRTGPACFADAGDPACANTAFNSFNVAFPGLLGHESQLDPADMQAFTDFVLRLTYPPNPIRPLDNSHTSAAAAGESLYFGRNTDTVANCNGCHVLDRSKGFFGTSGGSTFENETMEFKVAHLRNAYQKVGRFGEPQTNFFPGVDDSFMGDQIRGTGFLHDGSSASVFNFLGASVFNLSEGEQRNLEAFVMEFDSDLAPIVGQQTTVTSSSGSDTLARVDLLIQRANTTYFTNAELGVVKECDLIAKGIVDGEQRGWVYVGGNSFQSDSEGESLWSKSQLLTEATSPGQPITFTCVPPGSGVRMGIDRDQDTILNAEDTATCSATRIGASGRRHLGLISGLTLLGLAFIRRQGRRQI